MTTIARLMGSGTPAAQAQATVNPPPSTGLSSAGGTQSTATLLTNDFSIFSTVTAGQGCRLPAANAASLTAQAGDTWIVVNGQATNALLVYPPVGGNFVGVAVNTAVSVPAGKTADFYCVGNNVWASSVGG